MNPTLIRIDGEHCFTDPLAVGQPLGEPVAKASLAAHCSVSGGATSGFWECSEGRFRRQVAQAEYSYIISGEGSFTPDDGAPVEFRAGDALYFTANTQGTWEIRQTVRKAYLILG
ncbi:cupin domain-containing protein [Pseudomonas putida]|jgi:hypothetical protein|uniref:cupin domain-containing protein n=1 Tax=Pseudomonas TaxID=286 RepID=UPI000C0E6957|nr:MULTISPECIES: cupin domain-containing protein [unclassified Pseudomonas]MBL1308506.1 cupin domain-containing protein [Pseudomonas sp.]NUU36637.1 cupin domain-containing protein [Pseudomonas sp. C2B4]